jgi:hypothetical protein
MKEMKSSQRMIKVNLESEGRLIGKQNVEHKINGVMKPNSKMKLGAFMFGLFLGMSIFANNVQVSGVDLENKDLTNNFYDITCTVQWDNSWRGDLNWDAAWIFAKYRVVGEDTWYHARFHYVDGKTTSAGPDISDGHWFTSISGASSGGVMSSTDDNGGSSNGIFIYTDNTIAPGTVRYDISLRWDYQANPLRIVGDEEYVEIWVYAVEMVRVPEGDFWLGDGVGVSLFGYEKKTGTQVSGTQSAPTLVTANSSFNISSSINGSRINSGSADPNPDDHNFNGNGSMQIARSNGNQFYTTGGISFRGVNPGFNGNWPTGWDAYYVMKYEISQDQYVHFLNCLDNTQMLNRTDDVVTRDGIENTRYGIELTDQGGGSFGYPASTIQPYLPASYLSFRDLLAYADWAGLRPMTGTEYEKAARGAAAVPSGGGEYAWGNTALSTAPYTLADAGQSSESINSLPQYNGNALYTTTSVNITGPVRVGAIPASATNNSRQEVGASYWGIMELSGNLWEQVVSLGSSQGRSFNGSHGNGALSAAGDHDQATWPNKCGWRGGAFDTPKERLRISDREAGSNQSGTSREPNRGGRLVRTAPTSE